MNRIRKLLCLIVIFLFCCMCFSQQNKKIEIIRIAPNLYKFHRFPSSFLALVGTEGVLLSDMADVISKEQLVTELKKLGNNNIKYVINTHLHHDHTYGNKLFGKNAIVISHKRVERWLSEDQELMGETFSAFPEYALPDLMFSSGMTLYFNRETIELFHLPGGHTDGDIIVYFKNANVLHVGDIVISDFMFPVIDINRGGSVRQLAENLQKIIETMPRDIKIIPGHIKGEYTINDLRKIKDMIDSTIEIVDLSIKDGKSLEKIKESMVLRKWKSWESPIIKCENWIEYIFHDLTKVKEGDKK